MSKFGSDNGAGNGGNGFGPKPTGQPSREATPNGFRLDSTQSSWLMDRLNALNEEDKLAMKAAAAEPLPRDADRAPVGPQGVPQGSPDGAPQGGQPDPRHFHPGQPQAPAPHAPMGERGADPQRGQPPRQGDGFGRPQQLRQQPPQEGAPRHYDGRPGDGHGHMPPQDLNRQQQDMSRQQAEQQRGGFDRALPGQMPQDETADFAERDYSESDYSESNYAESNHPENEYADGDYEPEGFDEGDDGYRLSDDPDENARLLREKIESLEKQIAEISQLNDDKRNQYREELVYRGVQLGKLKEQAELDQNAERKSYYRGTEVPPRPEQPPVEETAEFDEAGAEEGQYFRAVGSSWRRN